MADATHYVIRGGIEGRERLRVLGRVMHATSTALFARLGVCEGFSCLDVGCGGGDVTLALARLIGKGGRVPRASSRPGVEGRSENSAAFVR